MKETKTEDNKNKNSSSDSDGKENEEASLKGKPQQQDETSRTEKPVSTSSNSSSYDEDVKCNSATGNGDESIAFTPNTQDVLLGRGKPIQSHPGNQHMLQLVYKYCDAYDSAPRADKSIIVENIIGSIKSNGGRFLESTEQGPSSDSSNMNSNNKSLSGEWREVPHATAYNKVSHAFRSYRRSTGKTTNSSGSKKKNEKTSTNNNSLSVTPMAVGEVGVGSHFPFFAPGGGNAVASNHAAMMGMGMPSFHGHMATGGMVPPYPFASSYLAGSVPLGYGQPIVMWPNAQQQGVVGGNNGSTTIAKDATTNDTKNVCEV